MQRRDFIKLSAITGATAALDSCGKPGHQLIRFIPEEDWTPGIAVWKPSICTLCPAGCGLNVRVMEGDAEVIRHGQLGVMKMGLAKKLEGNPHHPVNHGRLCARGQAGLQVTYHPDRLRHPLRRTGPRGSGQFQEIGWDEAVGELVTQLQTVQAAKGSVRLEFISRRQSGQQDWLLQRFMRTLGANPPAYFEFLNDSVLRQANRESSGRYQLPTFDLAQCNYLVSFGADFLGTWNSPVALGVGYGSMRQGRPGRRGKFVMFESRLSQTGGNSDEWIPVRPGTEGALALGLAHVMMQEGLRPAKASGPAGNGIPGWATGLKDYIPEYVEKRTGVAAFDIARIAREMSANSSAIAIIGGPALAHTNSYFNALAVNALNELMGSFDKPGGVFFAPQPDFRHDQRSDSSHSGTPVPPSSNLLPFLSSSRTEDTPKVLLLYDANPVFASPAVARVRAGMEKIPFIASFGSFIDETSVMADLILPDHSPLESWLDHVPESQTSQAVASLAPPVMLPLHNTRQMADVLLDVAHRLGGDVAKALPWKTYEEMLKNAFQDLEVSANSHPAKGTATFWDDVQKQGGCWGGTAASPSETAQRPRAASVQISEIPEFDGDPAAYPFHFQPFASTMFYDGSLAHLPWLQEAPDPLSTTMWSTWVEINPQTASRLGIQQGDLVEVASQSGKLQAPALPTPAIAPDVIAMPIGQGHENFTRYANGRGANPLAILAVKTEPKTGTLAWAATRVKITRVGPDAGKLILFGGSQRSLADYVEKQGR
jgi:anaerobic selenocysteine-containing dehydrogenase